MLFEQFVGMEILRFFRARMCRSARLRFWRDPNGPEVDWVVACDGKFLPIEVKWTDSPDAGDTRHVNSFIKEYPTFDQGFVVCRAPRKVRLGERVMALPWQTFLDELALVVPSSPAST